jgi:pantoate--beta-alanine ligase
LKRSRLQVVRSVPALRAALAGHSVALVPTMGALHEGHLSLVDAAAARAPFVVVSIFVNRLQFGPSEDFAAYPRDLDRDTALLATRGADLVFAPDAASFTPPDLATTVSVSGLTTTLEGASRPGHFDGVATIVTKLLSAVRPEAAVFGEKDYQQLLVIRRLVADLDLGVEVLALPIVREPDGLAMSSRNAYLSPGERDEALALHRALRTAAEGWRGDADLARRLLRTRLADAPGVRLEYAEVADPDTLAPLEGIVAAPARALVAAFVGRTRLIDNMRLEPR